MARKQINERQKLFAQNRAKGMNREQSALMAGYSESDKAGRDVEKSPLVQQELAAIRAKVAEGAGITKEDVAAGFMDAALMAKVMADPQGMVAAWREMGKLLGFYAPEVKKIEKGINKRDLLTAMDTLSDDDLQKLSRGRVIDGSFEDVSPVPQDGAERLLLSEPGGRDMSPVHAEQRAQTSAAPGAES